ncbi:unnamed protein product [Pleuronectes platessa]|uniref:Uncharacterized protein n=1 Tax=Pleuronectes platessa TaxID=8262 RepID=A0A9N7VPR0_PLEPL|nr:unnamed protein product [Pleuronectes platessa]
MPSFLWNTTSLQCNNTGGQACAPLINTRSFLSLPNKPRAHLDSAEPTGARSHNLWLRVASSCSEQVQSKSSGVEPSAAAEEGEQHGKNSDHHDSLGGGWEEDANTYGRERVSPPPHLSKGARGSGAACADPAVNRAARTARSRASPSSSSSPSMVAAAEEPESISPPISTTDSRLLLLLLLLLFSSRLLQQPQPQPRLRTAELSAAQLSAVYHLCSRSVKLNARQATQQGTVLPLQSGGEAVEHKDPFVLSGEMLAGWLRAKRTIRLGDTPVHFANNRDGRNHMKRC